MAHLVEVVLVTHKTHKMDIVLKLVRAITNGLVCVLREAPSEMVRFANMELLEATTHSNAVVVWFVPATTAVNRCAAEQPALVQGGMGVSRALAGQRVWLHLKKTTTSSPVSPRPNNAILQHDRVVVRMVVAQLCLRHSELVTVHRSRGSMNVLAQVKPVRVTHNAQTAISAA